MGEPEVRAKNRENKKKYVVDSLKNNVNSCLKSRDKINNTIKNLGSLLQEKYEFIDEDGLKRTILGEKSTPKQQAKGIYGTRDVFVTPGYKGQPFEEVGREMPAHFKMYCLINGISDKEMLSIGEKAPKGALREKLLLLKKEFIAMVANKDMAAIEDYYVGIADYVEKKLPILMSCDSPEKLVKYADEFFCFYICS